MQPRHLRHRRRLGSSAFLLAAAGAVIGLSGSCAAAAASEQASTRADSSADRSGDSADATVGDYYFDISDWDDTEKDEVMEFARDFHELRDHVKWSWPISDEEKELLSRSDFFAVGQIPQEDAGQEVGRRRLLAEEDPEDLLDVAEASQRRDLTWTKGATAKISFHIRGSSNTVLGGKAMSARQNDKDTFKCYDDDPDLQVPCPPNDFGAVCDKYNPKGSFRSCYEMCKPSFCCIHDSLSQTYSPSCGMTEPNCPSYFPCYIVWWKLHDTIGPANFLRTEQDEDFYDMPFEDIRADLDNSIQEGNAGPFSIFQQLFGHHFDTDDPPTDATFENPDNW